MIQTNMFIDKLSKDVNNIEKLKRHAINLEKYGLNYTQSIAKENLTQDEKLIITYLAALIAIKLEHYSKKDQLLGFLLYGLLICEYYDSAENLVNQTINPNYGGSLGLISHYLLNIKWIKKYAEELEVKNNKLEDAADKIEKMLKEFLDRELEKLITAENTFRNKENSTNRNKIFKILFKVGLVIVSYWLASEFGKFLAILTINFIS
ncbi:MAG: hypothetical protein N3E50_02020 [Candidatus Goldbacteria bacterium]|nr:hypothetical protein [Candidatus Goldiibacteriota bacterium]